MSEAKLKKTATNRLLAQHPFCCFCGGETVATTREHYPPKALFDNSHRPDQLVAPACNPCNDVSRNADLVTAIVARWRFSELEETEAADIKKLIQRLRYQAPNIGREWLEMSSGTGQKRARRHLQNNGVPVSFESGYVSVGQETIPQLNLFSHKIALAMYFDATKTPLPLSGVVFAQFSTKEDVIANGIPDEVKAHLGAPQSLKQGQWDTRLHFEFRTALSDDHNVFQVFARLRYGLFVHGTIVVHPELSPDIDWNGWLHPNELPSILLDPRFHGR